MDKIFKELSSMPKEMENLFEEFSEIDKDIIDSILINYGHKYDIKQIRTMLRELTNKVICKTNLLDKNIKLLKENKCRFTEKIESIKPQDILIVVAPQNDYFEGLKAIPESNHAINNICWAIQLAAEKKANIIIIRNYRKNNYCIQGSHGALINNEIIQALEKARNYETNIKILFNEFILGDKESYILPCSDMDNNLNASPDIFCFDNIKNKLSNYLRELLKQNSGTIFACGPCLNGNVLDTCFFIDKLKLENLNGITILYDACRFDHNFDPDEVVGLLEYSAIDLVKTEMIINGSNY